MNKENMDSIHVN